MMQQGLTIEEVDALTGRPTRLAQDRYLPASPISSALDVIAHVATQLRRAQAAYIQP